MKAWKYTALSAAGSVEVGTETAESEASAVDLLLARKLTPLKVELSAPGPEQARMAASADRLSILRALSMLFQASVPSANAFEIAQTLVPARQVKRLAVALDKVRSGASLSQALRDAGVISDDEMASLAAGEAAGRAAESLRRLFDDLAKDVALRSELTSAAIYPIILVVALAGTLAVIFGAVVPALRPIFDDRASQLPALTVLLLEADAFFRRWGLLLLAAIITAALSAWLWSRSSGGRQIVDRMKLSSPLWLGLPRLIAGEQFARTLSTLLAGGVPMAAALERCAFRQPNTFVRSSIKRAGVLVKGGAKLGAALKVDAVLPPTTIELIRVGEETGRLAMLSGEAARLTADVISARLKRLATLFVPIATLVLGAMVALVMAGVVGGIMAATLPQQGM